MFYTPRIDGTYKIACDLKLYLKHIGISEEHIKLMEEKIAQPQKIMYVRTGRKNNEHIKVNKIIGGSRFTIGSSIIDNVSFFEKDERSRDRFERFFEKIDSDGLESIKQSFENAEENNNRIIVDYYSDVDEYFITDDGNHRALIAMLIGVEEIFAEVCYCEAENR